MRVLGTVLALDFRTRNAGYLSDLGPKLRHFALERGVLLRPLGNVLYALPPLNTPPESLHRIADAIAGAVA